MLGLNPYAIIAAVVLALSIAIGGYVKGRNDANSSWELRIAEKEREARLKEQKLQKDADNVKNELQAENKAISGRLADAIERLRNRPERLPAVTLSACKGSTGAELSRTDASFLEREAARADEFRAGLKACEAWADSVKEAIK
jgi:hypothetical protein